MRHHTTPIHLFMLFSRIPTLTADVLTLRNRLALLVNLPPVKNILTIFLFHNPPTRARAGVFTPDDGRPVSCSWGEEALGAGGWERQYTQRGVVRPTSSQDREAACQWETYRGDHRGCWWMPPIIPLSQKMSISPGLVWTRPDHETESGVHDAGAPFFIVISLFICQCFCMGCPFPPTSSDSLCFSTMSCSCFRALIRAICMWAILRLTHYLDCLRLLCCKLLRT